MTVELLQQALTIAQMREKTSLASPTSNRRWRNLKDRKVFLGRKIDMIGDD